MKWKRYYIFWQSVILNTQTIPPPSSAHSYAHPYSPFPRHIHSGLTPSIFLHLSPHHSVCVIMCTSTKPSCIQTDPSIYSQPARLSTCLLVNASLSYLSLSTSLAKPAKKLNTVYVLLRNYPFCKDVITLSSHYKQIWGLWTFEKTLNLCSNCSRNYKFHQLNIKLQAQAQQTFAKKPLLILRGWFYWRDANFV